MKLVDTDICIAFLNGRDKAIQRQVLDEADELLLCSVVKG